MTQLKKPSWVRDYRAWFVGDTLGAAGGSVSAFAFPLVALAVTGSAQTAGIIGLTQGVGSLIGLLPGGVIADRVDRRRVRIIGGALGFAFQLGLALLVASGAATAVSLGTLAFCDRLRSGLAGPSSDAILKDIVPRRELPNKFALNSGRDSVIDLAGAPLGGLIMGIKLFAPNLFAAAGHALLAISSCYISHASRTHDRTSNISAKSALRDLGEAARWVASQSIRIHVLALATLINLVTAGILTCLSLHFAVSGLPYPLIGLLTTGLSAAVVLGALASPTLLRRVPGGTIVFCSFLVASAVAVGVAVHPSFSVSFVLFCVLGLVVAPLMASTSGYLAQSTPSKMLGRVEAITRLSSSLLMPLAPAVAGIGLDNLGAQATLGLFATLSLIATASVLLIRKGVRRIPVVGSSVSLGD